MLNLICFTSFKYKQFSK